MFAAYLAYGLPQIIIGLVAGLKFSRRRWILLAAFAAALVFAAVSIGQDIYIRTRLGDETWGIVRHLPREGEFWLRLMAAGVKFLLAALVGLAVFGVRRRLGSKSR